ncbi:MAG TPA: AraC family transcriptional regulator [Candidatus Yaniella excrementavium]|nr:AraC family transcriptional regulator [Candidatus Yaniella excrementavium]
MTSNQPLERDIHDAEGSSVRGAEKYEVRRLSGKTPEEAQQLGTSVFYPHRLRVRGGRAARFEMLTSSLDVGPFTISTLQYSEPVTIATPNYEDFYQVNVALKGSFKTQAGTQRLVASEAHAGIYRPDVETAISGWETPCLMLGIKMCRTEFERIASAYLGTEGPGRIDFSLPLRVNKGPGAAWLASVRRLAQLRNQPWSQPLVRDQLIEEAVIRLLGAGQHSHHDGVMPSAISTSSLERAVDLIETVPEEALTLESIAYVAGVSGRALQLAFRKELGTTPMQYLKACRLDRVAEALGQSAPDGPTVADCARRFGFTHMGRFSADYTMRHGELPSETRKK